MSQSRAIVLGCVCFVITQIANLIHTLRWRHHGVAVFYNARSKVNVACCRQLVSGLFGVLALLV